MTETITGQMILDPSVHLHDIVNDCSSNTNNYKGTESWYLYVFEEWEFQLSLAGAPPDPSAAGSSTSSATAAAGSPPDPSAAVSSTSSAAARVTNCWIVSAAGLVPLPRIGVRPSTASGKGRRSVPAAVLTSSPYKAALRESKVGKKSAAKRAIDLNNIGRASVKNKTTKPVKKATNRGDIKRVKKQIEKVVYKAVRPTSRLEKQQTALGTAEPAESTV
jgi:hypothetical protein